VGCLAIGTIPRRDDPPQRSQKVSAASAAGRAPSILLYPPISAEHWMRDRLCRPNALDPRPVVIADRQIGGIVRPRTVVALVADLLIRIVVLGGIVRLVIFGRLHVLGLGIERGERVEEFRGDRDEQVRWGAIDPSTRSAFSTIAAKRSARPALPDAARAPRPRSLSCRKAVS